MKKQNVYESGGNARGIPTIPVINEPYLIKLNYAKPISMVPVGPVVRWCTLGDEKDGVLYCPRCHTGGRGEGGISVAGGMQSSGGDLRGRVVSHRDARRGGDHR